MKKILFVCTGNTCRSPMAEVIAGKVFADKKIDAEVRSAGVYASSGSSASTGAAEAVKKYGVDLSLHIARVVTPEELQWADLIIAMTRSHKALINSIAEDGLTGKIFTIYEYAKDSDQDVQDPFMCGQDVYEECAEEIFALVNAVAEKFL